MDDSASDGVLKRGYDWISGGVNAWTVFGAGGVASLVAWLLPFDWKTGVPWALTLTAAVGALAVFRSGLTLIRNRRWANNRPCLTLTADSGTHGCIGVQYRGEPTTLSARGNIVKTLDGSVNKSPHWFEPRITRGGSGSTAMFMQDEGWGQIVLGYRQTSPSGTLGTHEAFVIQRGGTVVEVPNGGVLVELRFFVEKPNGNRETLVVETYSIKWDAKAGIAVVAKESSL